MNLIIQRNQKNVVYLAMKNAGYRAVDQVARELLAVLMEDDRNRSAPTGEWKFGEGRCWSIIINRLEDVTEIRGEGKWASDAKT